MYDKTYFIMNIFDTPYKLIYKLKGNKRYIR